MDNVDLESSESSPTSTSSALPPPPTPDYVDDGSSYLSQLNERILTPATTRTDNSSKSLLYLARADALLQQFQQHWNEIIVLDAVFFFLYLCFFLSHPSQFGTLVLHIPHIIRAFVGYKIARSTLIPDLLDRSDKIQSTQSFASYFKRLMTLQIQELEKDVVMKEGTRYFSRKRMLFAYTSISLSAVVLDVVAVIITSSIVVSSKDALRCILSLLMLGLDIRLFIILQQPSAIYHGDRAFSCTTICNAISLDDLLGKTREAMDGDSYAMQNLDDLNDDDEYDTNYATLMSGQNNTIIDTRASQRLEQRSTTDASLLPSPEKPV